MQEAFVSFRLSILDCRKADIWTVNTNSFLGGLDRPGDCLTEKAAAV